MTNDDRIATLLRQRDDLHHQIADLMTRCANLRLDRDAWRETAQRAMSEPKTLRDATDPGPQLVAETRAAFPWRAIRGGDGRFMG
jgi:hypothetical protein